MKVRLIIPLALVMATICSGVSLAGHLHLDHDGYNFDFEGSTLVIEDGSRHSETVEISADMELFVDGREIQTDRKDRKLLKAYYEKAEEIEEAAMEIGAIGARLGVEGAALGIKAVGNLLRLLSDDYDIDDYEEEIETEAESIEFAAEGIEEAAEELESWVEELQDIGDELQDRIEELDDLSWF